MGSLPLRPDRARTRSISGRLLLGAVELGQAEVAVAEEAQHGGHALDRGGERGGRLRLGGLQQGADVDQVLQRREVRQRAALRVAAVGQHLAGKLRRQKAQHAVEVGRLVRQRRRPPRSAPSARSARGRPSPRWAARRTGGAHRRPAAPSASGGTHRRRSRRRTRNGRARRRCARRSRPGDVRWGPLAAWRSTRRPGRGRAAAPPESRSRAGRAARRSRVPRR